MTKEEIAGATEELLELRIRLAALETTLDILRMGEA